MIEQIKQTPSAGRLRALPVLPVLRPDFCGQEAADKAVSFLERDRPDLLLELLAEEGRYRTDLYAERAWEAADAAVEAGAGVPATPLGRLGFALELSRRLRAAYGMAEMFCAGRPLAARPGDPLPPLPALGIGDGTRRRAGLTQEQADRLLQQAYAARPELWFALAEECRYDLPMQATADILALFEHLAAAEPGAARNSWTAGELRLEALRRLYKLCALDDKAERH